MKYPLWKPIVVVLVIALFALLLYPPSTRLKPGIDLAGGTTLIYNVNIPEDTGRSNEQIIDETISVLRERVDPSGLMNLVWRQVAGNRIEIQMALASPEVKQRREAFKEAEKALFAGQLNPRQVENAMQMPAEQRSAELEKLAKNNPQTLAKLRELATLYDAFAEASNVNQQTQAAYNEAQAALNEAVGDEQETLQKTVDNLLQELIVHARAYNAARDAYNQALNQKLASNVTPAELEKAFAAENTRPGNAGVSARDEAIDQLVADHPEQAEQIRKVAADYASYEEVKGPLDDPNDLITLLQGSGILEFRIVAATNEPGLDVEGYLEQLQERGPNAGRSKPWRWFAIDDIAEYVESDASLAALERDPGTFFNSRNIIGAEYGGRYYLLLANIPGMAITYADEGWELTGARRGADELGQPAIDFTLNAVGGQLMGSLHRANQGREMAIVLDGQVISSPRLSSDGGIITTRGQISGGRGGFNQTELAYLLRTLRAGSLEGTIGEYPISIKTTGPQLGQDNLEAGLKAAIAALILVAVFMAAYYLAFGLIADFALFTNMVLILGTMAMFQATFTLPGIAGIVLTIGMAVDANVLIFERIREELARKADFKTAVRLGYEKAFSTIIDANITTFITCVVLFYTASAEVKGFAITLMIGILATLFTALFATRVIVEMAIVFGKVRGLPMLPTLIPAIGRTLSPNINWVSKRYGFFVISGILMISGISMVAYRGVDMLDIEFRSGTQVSFDLKDDQTLPIGEARERLQAYGAVAALLQNSEPVPADRQTIADRLRTVVAEAEERAAEDPNADPLDFRLFEQASVVTEGETTGDAANAFGVSTLMTDALAVSGLVKAAFADELAQTRPIDFARMDAERIGNAPVFPIRTANLGEDIDRPLVNVDATDYLGGAAIVLEDLRPAVTIEDIEDRIARMRMQPAFEKLGFRQYTVEPIGAPASTDAEGNRYYSAAVVMTRDEGTNYIEDPDAFADRGGLADTEWSLVVDALRRDTSLASVNNFSSQVSGTMQQQAIVALSLSLLAVVAYIWLRFGSIRYGLAAIIALVHDVALTLGLVAISGYLQALDVFGLFLLDPFKIDLAMVAAVLTIVGYSLNDTIVVFDRIRENRGRLARETPQIVNDSINQTISRTVLTSGTTLLAVLTLYILGGAGVHGFAFAMLIGVAVGTYSSVAIASPALLALGGGLRAPEPPQAETKPPIADKDMATAGAK